MCLTADSPADLADYAEECSRAALFRRQKTVSANVSAKADAADNAEKDSYHIVECCSCLYNKSVREHACCSLLVPYVIQTAVLTEIKETKESRLSNRKRLQETHLKVSRKASRKFHKGVYYASEFFLE